MMSFILSTIFALCLISKVAFAVDQISGDVTNDNVGSTTDIIFSVSPTAGCTILVGWVGYNATPYDADSVTDDQSNSYTILKHSQLGLTTSQPMIAIASSIAGGVTTVTINNTTGSGNYIRARAISVCSVTGVETIDGEADSAPSPTQTTVATNSATTNNTDFVFAVIQVAIASSDVHLSDPASSGYTSLFREQNHSAHVAGGADYKQINSIQTPDATWTHDSTAAGRSLALIKVIKLSNPSVTVRRKAIIW